MRRRREELGVSDHPPPQKNKMFIYNMEIYEEEEGTNSGPQTRKKCVIYNIEIYL
jgi:hypothetical protein